MDSNDSVVIVINSDENRPSTTAFLSGVFVVQKPIWTLRIFVRVGRSFFTKLVVLLLDSFAGVSTDQDFFTQVLTEGKIETHLQNMIFFNDFVWLKLQNCKIVCSPVIAVFIKIQLIVVKLDNSQSFTKFLRVFKVFEHGFVVELNLISEGGVLLILILFCLKN